MSSSITSPHLSRVRTLSIGTEVAGTTTELWSFREVNQSSVLFMCAQDLGKIPALLPSETSSPHKVALFSYQGPCTHSFQTQ